jgi:hypothetical protein
VQRQARKGAKAGKIRRKGTQEKAQKHARKGALPDKKRRKGRQDKLQRQARSVAKAGMQEY